MLIVKKNLPDWSKYKHFSIDRHFVDALFAALAQAPSLNSCLKCVTVCFNPCATARLKAHLNEESS